MKDLLLTKEFSRLSGIKSSTLRYWDSIGLFSPAQRDETTNYRYYTPMQVITARFISVLRSLGISLQEIMVLEKERSPEKMARLIQHQKKILIKEMNRLQGAYSVINTRFEMIDYGMKVQDGFNVAGGVRMDNRQLREDQDIVNADSIAVLRREEQLYIIGPRNDFKEGDDFYEVFRNFCQLAPELMVNLSFPIAAYHDNFETFAEAPGKPEHFISMDPSGNRVREAGNYLVGFCYNYYGRFDDLPERMTSYIKEHSIVTVGPVFVLYLQDEICVTDPLRYLAEVIVRVADRSPMHPRN